MKVSFTETAWQEYQDWLDTDRKLARRIAALIKEIQRTPFEGTGKPEPLRGNLSGYWSRRIDRAHRLVYQVDEGVVTVIQCKGHY